MSGAGWRVWIFGGGTALPSVQRDNTFLALEMGAECWLVDCAAGPYRKLLQVGISPSRLQGVILTHSHADHIYGLPALLFQLSLAGYEGQLNIYGLGDTIQLARRVVESFELEEHCARHEWQVIEPAAGSLVDIPISAGRLRVGLVSHSRPAMGVRWEAEGGPGVAYSGDTAPCPGIVQLARGAGWLLHECTVSQPLSGHSTPEEVGATAVAAGVAHLGIVHYDPAYGPAGGDVVKRIQQAGFAGTVRVMEDLDCIPMAA